MDNNEIRATLPHRYPFLLVDRVLGFEPGRRSEGMKNVSFNEPFFQGHFPGRPVMPGVLIVEAMAQAAGVLVCASCGAESASSLVYFTSIEQARFRRPVLPGDTLRLDMAKL